MHTDKTNSQQSVLSVLNYILLENTLLEEDGNPTNVCLIQVLCNKMA